MGDERVCETGGARGVGPADSNEVAEATRHLATTPTNQKIEHRLRHLAVVRPKSEFPQIAVHIFATHMDVGVAD